MEHEKLFMLASDSRLISASDHILFPLIKAKIEQRINLACSNFIGGKTDFISDIAYIQGLKEIEQYLKRIQAEGNKANLELNKDSV